MAKVHKADVIVLGLGAMGSAALFHLAKTKQKVIGIEQFQVGHDRGSSHGETRLIRQAYFEHTDYVPLLKEAYKLWFELADLAGKRLFHQNGLVILGHNTESNIVQGVLKSAEEHQIKVEALAGTACQKRFPFLKIPKDFLGVFEPGAGFLEVENCNIAHAAAAEKAGAVIFQNQKVKEVKFSTSKVEVFTERESFQAEKLVITAGAWSSKFLPDLPLTVHRVVLGWYECPDRFSLAAGLPCFAVQNEGRFFYAFPKLGKDGLKIGEHIPGELVKDAYALRRETDPDDFTEVSQFIRDFLPGVKPEPKKGVVCMYTMTPDEHFIVDSHPNYKNVFFGAGFSGHGFKFAPVIGKALAQLVTDGKTNLPVNFLNLARLNRRA